GLRPRDPVPLAVLLDEVRRPVGIASDRVPPELGDRPGACGGRGGHARIVVGGRGAPRPKPPGAPGDRRAPGRPQDGRARPGRRRPRRPSNGTQVSERLPLPWGKAFGYGEAYEAA